MAASLGEDPIACANGGMCTISGICVDGAGAGGANGGFGGFGGIGPDGGSQCADTTVRSNRVIPTVVLLVDQSSRMTENFGGTGSRWDVLRDFLLETPNGLISDLQSQVRFGLALYSATSGDTDPLPIGECPMITSVAPDNYDAIAAVYSPAYVIEDTPTGDSIDAVVNSLDLNAPDRSNEPVVIILATDGEPDRCEELDPQNGQRSRIFHWAAFFWVRQPLHGAAALAGGARKPMDTGCGAQYAALDRATGARRCSWTQATETARTAARHSEARLASRARAWRNSCSSRRRSCRS